MKGDILDTEWMRTYGWAVLIILIVAGTLVYYGYINPSALETQYQYKWQCIEWTQSGATYNRNTLEDVSMYGSVLFNNTVSATRLTDSNVTIEWNDGTVRYLTEKDCTKEMYIRTVV